MTGWKKLNEALPDVTDLVIAFIPPGGYLFCSGSEYAHLLQSRSDITHFKVISRSPENEPERILTAFSECYMEAGMPVEGDAIESFVGPINPVDDDFARIDDSVKRFECKT